MYDKFKINSNFHIDCSDLIGNISGIISSKDAEKHIVEILSRMLALAWIDKDFGDCLRDDIATAFFHCKIEFPKKYMLITEKTASGRLAISVFEEVKLIILKKFVV